VEERAAGHRLEKVGREFHLDGDERLEARQVAAQEVDDALARHDFLGAVDAVVGDRQDVLHGPDVAVGADAALAVVDEVDGDLAGLGEGQFGGGEDKQVAGFVVEVDAQAGRHGDRFDNEFAPARDGEPGMGGDGEEVEEIGRREVDAAGRRAFADVFEHREQVVVLGRERVACVAGHPVGGKDVVADEEQEREGDASAIEVCGPRGREGESETGGDAAGAALDVGGLVDLFEATGAALVLLILLFARGVGVAEHEGDAEGDDVGADLAAVLVGETGTMAFDAVGREEAEFGIDFGGGLAGDDAGDPVVLHVRLEDRAAADELFGLRVDSFASPFEEGFLGELGWIHLGEVGDVTCGAKGTGAARAAVRSPP